MEPEENKNIIPNIHENVLFLIYKQHVLLAQIIGLSVSLVLVMESFRAIFGLVIKRRFTLQHVFHFVW